MGRTLPGDSSPRGLRSVVKGLPAAGAFRIALPGVCSGARVKNIPRLEALMGSLSSVPLHVPETWRMLVSLRAHSPFRWERARGLQKLELTCMDTSRSLWESG